LVTQSAQQGPTSGGNNLFDQLSKYFLQRDTKDVTGN